jgi:hypothetical protein
MNFLKIGMKNTCTDVLLNIYNEQISKWLIWWNKNYQPKLPNNVQ